MAALSFLPIHPYPPPPPPPRRSLPKRGALQQPTASVSSTAAAALLANGVALVLTAAPPPAHAALLPVLSEPSNALSLPTWAVHVSSVVEWIAAMVLVWEYGEKSGFPAWKALSWGMVPLLGGAFCACTWHFFYNSESLEILVAIQATLTIIGNTTMGIAAFRIYKASQEGSESS